MAQTVEYQPVESSNIKAVGFVPSKKDPEVGTLYVLFKRDRQYKYLSVKHETYLAMLKAPSVGSFLNQEIIPNHVCKSL